MEREGRSQGMFVGCHSCAGGGLWKERRESQVCQRNWMVGGGKNLCGCVLVPV